MLTTGALFLCSILLAFAMLSRVCGRPVPPRWTKRSGAAELITMIFATVIVAGLASLALGVGAVGPDDGGINPVDLGTVALVLAGTVLLWRRLRAREHTTRPTAAAPVVTMSPSADASVVSAVGGRANAPAERAA